jgi:hypothetical protein
MSWLRLDDDMLDHPKWIRALRDGGAEALLVWTRLSLWCSKHLTDGRIPGDTVAEVARLERSKTRARALQALVEHGLCTRHVDGAIVIHGYLERNPSKADTIAERERRAKSQRDYTLRKKLTGQQPIALPGPDPVALRPPDDVPSPPVPSRPLPISLSDESESTRAPQVRKPPEHPRPLQPSRRERRSEAEAARLGTTPVLRHEFRRDWRPNEDHQQRGHELGLSDEDILKRAEDCRKKPIKHGFYDEDDHFFRELTWAARDASTERFKRMSQHERDRFENPGRDRATG